MQSADGRLRRFLVHWPKQGLANGYYLDLYWKSTAFRGWVRQPFGSRVWPVGKPVRTSIAWRNVIHDKPRTLAAVSGVVFAVLLVFMQLGFYTACRTSATMIYDACDFDAILLAKPYVHMRLSHTFPRERLDQAQGVPGVAEAIPLYLAPALWRNVETKKTREVLLLGFDPAKRPFVDEALNALAGQLSQPDVAVMDQIARPLIGPHPAGTVTEVNGRRIKIAADYRRGAGLVADGTLLVSDLNYARLTGQTQLDRVQLGLIRFAAGADREKSLSELRKILPTDTVVWPRAELERLERHFFLDVKPLGFMFQSGVWIGFIVGAVILYQILSADVANQSPQYATLKALGYRSMFLYGVVVKQGLYYALLGFAPALALAFILYEAVRRLADLPMHLTPGLIGFVFALCLAMCTVSGLLAVRKVDAADPADLFA